MNERRNAETKIFRLPNGQEVLCIYCWPKREWDPINYTATFPSRRLDPVTPEALREYASVWAEAAAWLAGADEHPGAALPVGGPTLCLDCGEFLSEASGCLCCPNGGPTLCLDCGEFLSEASGCLCCPNGDCQHLGEAP